MSRDPPREESHDFSRVEDVNEEALLAGRDAGCQLGVLQPSEMAYRLYEQMGFEQIATYHHFESTV